MNLLLCLQEHSQSDPLYETTYFKAKMNAYATFVIGQSQQVKVEVKEPNGTLGNKLIKNTTEKKSKIGRGSFLDERHSGDVPPSCHDEEALWEATAAVGSKKKFMGDHNLSLGDEDLQANLTENYLYEEKQNRQESPANKNRFGREQENKVSKNKSRWEGSIKLPDDDDDLTMKQSSRHGEKSYRQSSRSEKRGRDMRQEDSYHESPAEKRVRDQSIRVVARAFGGQHKHDDYNSTEEDLVMSGENITKTVHKLANKIDENERIIEELKKKASRRIREKLQAQTLKDEEEAKSREKDEKEAKMKLEDKLDKLSKRKNVVESKKNHNRFPLIGKMPFFKSKPTKSVPSGSGRSKEENALLSTTPGDAAAQDIEDPKFLKNREFDNSGKSSPCVPNVDDNSRENISNVTHDSDGSRQQDLTESPPTYLSDKLIKEDTEAFEMTTNNTQEIPSTGSKFGDELSKRIRKHILDTTKVTSDDADALGNASSPDDKTNEYGTVIKPAKPKPVSASISVSKTKPVKLVKATSVRKSKSEELKAKKNLLVSGSVAAKTTTKKTKSSAKSSSIPLVNIPLPATDSTATVRAKPKTSAELAKLAAETYGPVNTNVPPPFLSTKPPPLAFSYAAEICATTNSYSNNPVASYGYSPFMPPYTTANNNCSFSPYHNTSGSPLQQLPNTVNMTDPSVISASGMGDYSILFSQPPPTAVSTAGGILSSNTDTMLLTSSPITAQMRESTPPPPGTEMTDAASDYQPNNDDDDLLPPGVEAHELDVVEPETFSASDAPNSGSEKAAIDASMNDDILAHVIPTKAQINSRLIEAGQLSPSAANDITDSDEVLEEQV